MERVRLGSTDLMVSPLGMGVIPTARLPWDESVTVIRGVYELGINLFDTAEIYGDTEQRMAEALGGQRHEVVLSTKSHEADPTRLPSQFDKRLRGLNTDYLDLFLFHTGHALTKESFLAPGGILEVAQDAVKAGKIRYLGFSAHKVEIALKGLEIEELSVIMVPTNFVGSEFLDVGIVELAAKKGKAVLGMKPLGGGRIQKPSLCFRYLRTFPGLVPCPGTETIDQMRQNLDAWERGAPLGPDDEAEIARIREELGNRFCRQCGYCMPCPQGVHISSVNSAPMYAKQLPREFYVAWMATAIETARGCIECRECVEKCPYELDIPAMLKENIAFFEEFVRAG